MRNYHMLYITQKFAGTSKHRYSLGIKGQRDQNHPSSTGSLNLAQRRSGLNKLPLGDMQRQHTVVTAIEPHLDLHGLHSQNRIVLLNRRAGRNEEFENTTGHWGDIGGDFKGEVLKFVFSGYR